MNNKVVYAWYHDNEIFYIGIGTKRRPYETSSRNPHCLNKRAKAKRENSFSVSILFKNLSLQQACQIEQELIAEFGRRDIGTGVLTNMTDGGEGVEGVIAWNKGIPLRNDLKENLRRKNLGRKMTKTDRAAMSRAKNGGKTLWIGDRSYCSLNEASEVTGTPANTIRYRVKSTNFPKYKYIA